MINFTTIYFFLVGLIITIFADLAALIVYPIMRPFGKQKAELSVHSIARKWGFLVSKISFIRPHFEGLENYDPTKTYIITPNHQSAFDIFFGFVIFKGKFAFVAKDTLFKIPFIGLAMHLAGYISVKRGSIGAIKSIDDSINMLKSQRSIIMYPEGTRSKTGELNFPKRGLLKITEELKDIEILPVVVDGTINIMAPKTYKMSLFRRVNIRFLPAFNINNIEGDDKAKLDYWYNLMKNNLDEIKEN